MATITQVTTEQLKLL